MTGDARAGGGAPPTSIELTATLAHLPIGVAICDASRRVLAANLDLQEVAGTSALEGRFLDELIQLEDRELAEMFRTAWRVLDGVLPPEREVWGVCRRASGPPVDVGVTARVVPGSAEVAVIVRRIDEERRRAESLRAGRRRFEELATNVAAGILSSEFGMRADYANQRCCEIFGAPEDRLLGFGWLDYVHPDDVAAAERAVDAVLASSTTSQLTVRLHVAGHDDDVRWVDVRVAPVTSDGRDVGFVASIGDITEARHLSLQLSTQALRDPVTGLPNRAALWEAVAGELDTDAITPAVLFVDIDDFKVVNDSFGHGTGDLVLAEVAGRLRGCARGSDLVARFGADEFVVLVAGADRQVAATMAQRVVDEVARPIVVAGTEISVTVSVGIVVPDGPVDPEALLRDADIAMHQAKAAGKRRATEFDEELRTSAQHRLVVLAELRRALDDGAGGLTVHYQPVVTLTSGAMVGVEALVRWQHPELGNVSPGEFVPLAEQAGLVSELDRFVLDRALADLAVWRAAPGGERLHVAVNLSARDLAEPTLVDDVAAALARHGLGGGALHLELTESAMMTDPERAHDVLAALRGLGSCVAMDDFGTGYSSLSYLQRLPIDIIKIDRGFVADLDEGSAELVEAIVALGHALSLPLVAEGVETAAQRDRLAGLGVELAQGYLFSPAVPAASIAAMLSGEGG
ncbi:MAG TPA: EAL domain-containing protein [Acidimicrobiales bacterium]|nr:EAL domain-containing protein [Acidimicrobiales bacterium]